MTESQTETRDELLEHFDEEFPESWQPSEPGEILVGAFLRLENGSTEFGPAPIVIVGTEEGERSVWLFAESLKRAFRRLQPAPGERIAIRYEGEQTVANPTPGRKKTAKVYRVVADRPKQARSVDWGAALDEPAAATVTPHDESDIPY